MSEASQIEDPWSRHLGIRLLDQSEAATVVEMPLEDGHMNFLAGAHGGALFSLAEAAVRAAAGHREGAAVVFDSHLVLTAGGEEGDVFTATARPISVGRTLGVYRVTVVRGDGRTVGELTATVRFGS